MYVYVVTFLLCVSDCFHTDVGIFTTQEKGIAAVDHDIEKRKAEGDIVGTDFTITIKDNVYIKKSIKNNRIWEYYKVEPIEVK